MRRIAACWILVFAAVPISSNLFAQDVSQSGSLVYQYPIKIPPGAGGMAPSLYLNYDSSMGNGILGMGWFISGLPVITRDTSYPVNFDDNTDHFLFDGQQLIKGTDGYYHTKYESFLKIQLFSPNTANSYWTATDKQGTVSFFGNSDSSYIEAMLIAPIRARVWALNKVIDTASNYYTVEYSQGTNGDYYPHEIAYTKNDASQPLLFNTIQFGYEDRSDHNPVFNLSLVEITKRLDRIQVNVGGHLLRLYDIEYQNGSSTGRSRITSIQEFGTDGITALTATTFSWQDGLGQMSAWNSGTSIAEASSQCFLADIDGDGKADFLKVNSSGHIYRGMSNGSGFSGWGWVNGSGNRIIFGDVNGDGKTDAVGYSQSSGAGVQPVYVGVMLSTGTDFASSNTQAVYNIGIADRVFLADVSGDGRADLIHIAEGQRAVYLGLSNGSSFSFWTWTSGSIIESNSKLFVADVNGDGKSDLIKVTSDGKVYVAFSSGSSFNGFVWSGKTVDSNSKIFLADVNGDGKADMIYTGAGATNKGWVYVTLSNTTFNGSSWNSGCSLVADTSNIFLADVNGDGKADLIVDT
jgi:hypothetical protein